jgi:hypothetical protein
MSMSWRKGSFKVLEEAGNLLLVKIPVAFINSKDLVALLIENDIDIHRTSYDLIDFTDGGEIGG